MRSTHLRKARETPIDRLGIFMKRLKITRRELSEKLGVSRSSVAMYFSAGAPLRLVVALAIQAAYGVRAEWIMTGRKSMMIESAAIDLSAETLEMAVLFQSLPSKEKRVAHSVLRSLAEAQRSSA